MHDLFDFFLLFGALIFTWNQLEKSIARRTADEIERRNKLPKAADLFGWKPPKPPRVSGRAVAILLAWTFGGLLLGVFVVGLWFAPKAALDFAGCAALVVGGCVAIAGLAAATMAIRGIIAFVSAGIAELLNGKEVA